MKTKFGWLSKINFLQDFASLIIAGVNPAIVHNIEKYNALKKVHYLSALDGLEGDYLEFGVFTGSSFAHSIRCCKCVANINSDVLNTKYFGFDSFNGFGELSSDDQHLFYTNDNFATNYNVVNKRIASIARGINYELVPGFFNKTLKSGAIAYGIDKAKIVFIDSDTYESAKDALIFCGPIVQPGSFFILDDYFSYRGNKQKGVKRAFDEFVVSQNLIVRRVLDYGMGGCVYIVSNVGLN